MYTGRLIYMYTYAGNLVEHCLRCLRRGRHIYIYIYIYTGRLIYTYIHRQSGGELPAPPAPRQTVSQLLALSSSINNNQSLAQRHAHVMETLLAGMCVCVCVCVCVLYVRMYTYSYICVFMYTCVCVYIYTYTYIHEYVHTYIHACMHISQMAYFGDLAG